MKKPGIKIASVNHKARRDYLIEDSFEAGIVLTGHEVKSIRDGKINLQDGFARIENEEAYLYNVHIAPYSHASYISDIDPIRKRKLLLHRREINKLFGLTQRKGYSLIPLDIYFKKSRAKITIAVGKGKHLHDKRSVIKTRELKRDMERNFKGRKNF